MSHQPEPSGPSRLRRYAEGIVRRLVEQQHTAYFAGGCVRDEALGRVPSDYDVATSATPDQVEALFGRQRTLRIGAAFGVVCVHERIGRESLSVEVATFRRDGTYADGRRPDSVEYAAPEVDAQRRDFTINGLFFDPISQRVIDYVGGRADLEAGIVRAIGDPYARFSEDKLRLLRAVRFATTFGFVIDPQTADAVRALAPTVTQVSPERIGGEMRRLLAHRHRAAGWQRLKASRLLSAIAPALDAVHPTDPDEAQLAAWLGALGECSFVVALAMIVFHRDPRSHAARHGLIDGLRETWRLSNEEATAATWMADAWETLSDRSPLPWSSQQPWLVRRDSRLMLQGLRVLVEDNAVGRERHAQLMEALEWPPERLNPQRWIDGAVLQQRGLNPGPIYAQLIEAAWRDQLDGKLASPADADAWLNHRQV